MATTIGIDHAPFPDLSADTPRPVPPTGTRLGSAIILTAHPGTSVCGRSMTVTAAVVVAGSPCCDTPTGTVTFSVDDGPASPVTLADGVAALTVPLSAGPHTVTACYTGDTRFKPAPVTTLTTWIWRTGFEADAS